MGFLKKLTLIAGVLVLGIIAAMNADFFIEKGRDGGPNLAARMIEHLDGSEGVVGMMFRKSAMVTPFLPPAPEGFTAHRYYDIEGGALYSDTQSAVIDAEFDKAMAGTDLWDRMTEEDGMFLDAYYNDMGAVYTTSDAFIDLELALDGIDRGTALLREMKVRLDAHYDRVDSMGYLATVQGVAWYERIGPVERADNAGRPHRLRQLEGRIGRVRVIVTARASNADLTRFLQTLDLQSLRDLDAFGPGAPASARLAAAR